MRAMVVKEFRQLLRDRRTLGLLVGLPVLLLVVFGYAANFDVSKIPTVVVGPQAAEVAAQLPRALPRDRGRPGGNRATVESRLRDGTAVVGIVTGESPMPALMDGTQVFSVQAAKEAFARMAQTGRGQWDRSPRPSPPRCSTTRTSRRRGS